MATKNWLLQVAPTRSTYVATVVLNGGDTSNDLEIPHFQDKTVHVFGSFGTSQASLKGLNDSTGTAQSLHRTNDPTLTYSALSGEVLGHIIENPRILRADATAGSGSGITVVVVATTPRG